MLIMRASFLSLMFCNAVFAAAPESCGLMEAKLPADRQTAFEFSQSKTISTISRPLRSSGLLGLSTGGELLWQTRLPLKSTIVIGAGSIRMFNREDMLVNELSDPAIQQMSDILLQLFSGNSDALDQSFASTVTCTDDGGWQLDLQPRSEELAKLLLSVNLTGHMDIEIIHFRDKRGDSTEIVLSPVPVSRLEELETYLGR